MKRLSPMTHKSSPKYKRYLLFVQYSATCEGATFALAIHFALNKKTAIRDFLISTLLKEHKDNGRDNLVKDGIEYFAPATQCYNLDNIKEKDKGIAQLIYCKIFSDDTLNQIKEAIHNKAMGKLSFMYYINYS